MHSVDLVLGMSLCRIHLKRLTSQAANHGWCYFGLSQQWFVVARPQPWDSMDRVSGPQLYSTASKEPSAPPIPKKKENPNARKVIAHVGKIIPYNVIQVISENGEDLGSLERRGVFRIMEERTLKLVLLKENADPPLYKLMTGKQIFEEQSKLREKQKLQSSPGPVQIREVSFLASIAKHDLAVKMKHVIQWIEKKHHVRITVLNSRTSGGPDKEGVLQELLQSMQSCATSLGNVQHRKDGRAVICVLRPLSDKELRKQQMDQKPQNLEEQTNQEQNQGTAPDNT